jgi:hypothetical protein
MKRISTFLIYLGFVSFLLLSGGPSCDCDRWSPDEEEPVADEKDNMYLEPSEIDFGAVSVGLSDTALVRPTRFTASLPDPILIYEVAVYRGFPDVYLGIGAAAESLVTDTLLTPDPPRQIPVTFAPSAAGVYSCMIGITTEGYIATDSIIVTGFGVEGCVFSRNFLHFGDVDVDDTRMDTLLVRNITGPPGGQNVTVTLENTLCPQWSFVHNGTGGASSVSWSLAPGEAAVCSLQFTPTDAVTYACDLKTNSDSYCGPISVAGTGVGAIPGGWITCYAGGGPDLHAVWGHHTAHTYYLRATGDEGLNMISTKESGCSWSVQYHGGLDTLSIRGIWRVAGVRSWYAAGVPGDLQGNGYVIKTILGTTYEAADFSVLIDYYNCMWASSTDYMFAAGLGISSMANGRHYDGTSWNDLMIDFGWSEVTGIFGSGPGDVWAVLKQDIRNVWHYDGTAWSDETEAWMDDELHDVWVHSSGIAYAVGAGEAIYYYDGSDWHDQSRAGGTTFYGVFGSAPNDVYAVGANALIYHWDGFTWRRQDAPTGIIIDLFDVWVSDDGAAYAVGQDRTIIRQPAP